jgi:hypothetical protein
MRGKAGQETARAGQLFQELRKEPGARRGTFPEIFAQLRGEWVIHSK